jgi:outer membrane protein OmpA-like peptidoglycan-associated protein
MIAKTTKRFQLLCALPLVAAFGCAESLPPRELVDARTAYRRAESGQAARLSPVQLHEAKLAEAASRTAEAGQQRAKAASDLQALQAQGLSATKAELAKSKEQLTAEQREIAEKRGQLALTGSELENERKARSEAEKRASEAMAKLSGASGFAIKEEARGTAITVPATALFASGNATLLPAAQEKLNAVAAALSGQSDRAVVVEAHTDAQGTEASNRDLSQKRAQAVAEYLVSRGVPAASIKAVGVGQGRPVADNKTPEGRASNRRIEIVLQPSQSPY